MKKKYDYIVVGAGLFGSTFANRAYNMGKKVLVIDKRNHIGGNVYTENIEGINVHKYGAHIFHTDYEDVWKFVNSFAEFNRFTNSPIARYKNEIYNLPFNMNTFSKIWNDVITPEDALKHINDEKREIDHNPKNLEERFKITEFLEEPYENLCLLAKKRGMVIRGGEADTERAAAMLLEEFRNCKLGRITLEVPNA